ncbi:MAG: 2-oxoacid:ferredoxin oxidoreductase subunit beta [Candidatus Hydrogenedentota bacterium]|nr:MAG: 2-oxoacid:ferredoxin oxidoreductase subunit beta [Candidatus Hydrogenedentota bacterium]
MTKQYTKKDFASDNEVRWCPGCGDYSILTAVQKTLPELGVPKEKFVFISGIGCSSRFPYYMNTYGFHTIHGRAPAIATGVKIANPDLSVWVITGDGDALSIGGNHILHALRRNVDINILLFNNEIYGLTKGQASPTTHYGQKTKSTPSGNPSRPVRPLHVALGSEATFIARTADVLMKHMQGVLKEAYYHNGGTFIEILQNCHIFNDGVFKNILDKKIRDDRIILLEDGKPMVFGANSDKGLRINALGKLEVVSLEEYSVDDLLVHDVKNPDPGIHFMLADMEPPEYPEAMGVIRAVKEPTFGEQIRHTMKVHAEQAATPNLEKLLYSGETWTVE